MVNEKKILIVCVWVRKVQNVKVWVCVATISQSQRSRHVTGRNASPSGPSHRPMCGSCDLLAK